MNIQALFNDPKSKLPTRPWFIDECNSSRVVLKSNCGKTVFHEEFNWPDTMSAEFSNELRSEKIDIANLLVAVSQ